MATRTDDQILNTWTSRLHIRLALRQVARKRYVEHPTAANRARLLLRDAQVADAQHVIARHSPPGVTAAALAFIRGEEGTKLFAYDDRTEKPWGTGPGQSAIGTKTIGTGLTAGDFPDHKVPDHITSERNDHLFGELLEKVYLPPVLAALKHAGIKPTRGVVTGCLSACFNLGIYAFKGAHGFETLTRALQPARGKSQRWLRRRLATALQIYDNPNDPRVHEGLHTRRVLEGNLIRRG